MLAARLHGPGDIRIEHVDKPKINKDEMLIKVKSAALCGTDLRMFRHGMGNSNTKLPITLGHEFSGIIAEVGEEVTSYHVGMAVAVAPNMGCGVCNQCIQGNTHHCKTYQALGIHLDGGFAEYVRIPKEAILQGNVTLLPDGLSFEEAALAEPLSSVYNGFVRCAIRLGDYVLIIGGGPIGVMHAKLALMAGAAKVMLNDRNQGRLEFCAKVDNRIIPVESSNLVDYVAEVTKGEGLDVCVVACSSPEAQTLAVELMGQEGRVNLFGGLPQEKQMVALNTNLIHYKELVVTGTTRASVGQFRTCLELIVNQLIDVKSLITSRFSIDEFDAALTAASSGQGLKSMINFPD